MGKLSDLEQTFKWLDVVIEIECMSPDRNDPPEETSLCHRETRTSLIAYTRKKGQRTMWSEPFCIVRHVAYKDDVGSFSAAKVAKSLEAEGWSWAQDQGGWQCPHCTKRRPWHLEGGE